MSSTGSTILNDLPYVQRQISYYIYPFCFVLGVVGCSLNVLLFSQQQFRTSSCCIYFLAMSIAMLVHMIWSISLSLYTLHNGDPVIRVPELCKLRVYLLQSTAMMYRWFLTAACFDRFALSSVNVRLRNFAKVQIAKRVIAITVCAWIILPVHTLILYNVRGITCGIVYSSAGALYHSIFATVMGAILPSSTMIICAILLNRNLKLKQKRRQNNGNHEKSEKSQKQKVEAKRDQQILVMLLVQVLIYLILMLPLIGVYFYNAATIYVTDKSVERVTIERFIIFMAELIILMYPVASFYIHTMASRMFRSELINIIWYVITGKKAKTTRVGPTTVRNQIETITASVSKMPAEKHSENPNEDSS